jgi:hypothetical protein
MFQRKKVRPETITGNLSAKWGSDVLDEGFVPFPKRLLRCLPALFGDGSGIKELQVCLAVADYLRQGLTRGPSTAFLGFLAGLSPDETWSVLEKLKSEGMIEFEGTQDELTVSNVPLRAKILANTAGIG